MKKIILSLLILIVANTTVKAQTITEQKGFKYNNSFDFTLAAGSNQSALALSWIHFIPITKNKKFKIGYGARFTSQFGGKLIFQTAPAKLTSDVKNIDSLTISSTQINALNVSINLQYALSNKIDVGFNIDAVGFSFGKKVTGVYSEYLQASVAQNQTAKPTAINTLLVGDNDIGSLNSELYLKYWMNPKWAIKVGANFLFTEYTTDNKLRLNNDRWRNKSLMGMIGITFAPFK